MKTTDQRGKSGRALRVPKIAAAVLIAAGTLLAACGGSSPGASNGSEPTGQQGNNSTPQIFNIAWPGEPSSLDLMATTDQNARTVANHIFETLFIYGKDGSIIPMLAKDYTASDDGLTYTINLREGVPFQNGETMTSADVVASLERWFQVSSAGKTMSANIASVKASGENTVVITLKEKTAMLLPFLAEPSQAAVIIPKDIAEAAGKELLKPEQVIGTGPYELDNWNPTESITLKRFDDYASLPGEPNGLGGAKKAILDEIVYHFIPDESVRLAGVETGQFQYAEAVSTDDLAKIDANPDLQSVILTPPVFPTITFEMTNGPTSNVLIRQAIAAALNMEPIIKPWGKDPRFYKLTGSIYLPGNEWYTDVAGDRYSQNDPEKAKALLKQAGYNGEPIKFLIYDDKTQGELGMQLVIKQQLEAVGLNIQADVVDYATIVSERNDPTKYNMWVPPASTRSDPSQMYMLLCNWPAPGVGWCDKDVMALFDQMAQQTDIAARKATWVKINDLLWDRVPRIVLGQVYKLGVMRSNVQGFVPLQERVFYDVSLGPNK